MQQDNIQPHIEPVMMKRVRDVMFLAHDEQEHSITWSNIAGQWILENPAVGIVRQSDNLFTLLDTLSRYTGIHPDNFTVTDNPYGDV